MFHAAKSQPPPVIDPSYPHPVYGGGWRFYGQTMRVGRWPIEKGDRVADIGCGNMPFPYAGVLVDRSLEDCTERSYSRIPADSRIFVEADIEKGLPFGYKSLDFSYCSHLLEHLYNPKKACDELKRVSKKGFIEVPNVQYEIFWGSGTTPGVHKWIAGVKDGAVFFRRYDHPRDAIKISREEARTQKKTDTIFRSVFRRTSYGRNPQAYTNRFMEAYSKEPELFTDVLLWDGGFDAFMEGTAKSHIIGL